LIKIAIKINGNSCRRYSLKLIGVRRINQAL